MRELESYAKLQIKKYILQRIPAELAWGPVYTVMGNSPYYTNGCVIFKITPTEYQISIAGTNQGLNGWIYQDLKTHPTHHWINPSAPAENHGYVLGGFYRGLQEILSGKDNSIGLTVLLEELCSASGCTIGVQGHSLGGALAPLLSLYLRERYSFLRVQCNIFAGPTVGDTHFVNYYTKHLGANTHRYDNALDAIPRGFNLLHTIPQMYQGYLNLTLGDRLKVRSVVSALQFSVLGLDVQPIKGEEYPSFAAVFNHTLVTSNGFESFLQQVIFQHVDAYCNHFGVAPLGQIMCAVPSTSLPSVAGIKSPQ